jgi:dTDP-4-dehydrorhamnose 3,5-epimerase
MEIRTTVIPDVLILEPRRFADERGVFAEVFSAEALQPHGVALSWVQDNHSISARSGTIRGLHFQTSPAQQAKIVRVIRGAIFDVAVDIRPGSETFGRHVSMELSADNWRQAFIPAGFAHGFCTLASDTEVIYKVSAPYSPAHEKCLRWNDPELAIPWPVSPEQAVLNARDAGAPLLRSLVR